MKEWRVTIAVAEVAIITALTCAAIAQPASRNHGPAVQQAATSFRNIKPPGAALTGAGRPTALAAGSSLQIDGWYALASPAPSLIRKFDPQPTLPGAEEITVFGKPGRKGETDWRTALLAQEPVYEASHSQAAQRLYAQGPEWTGPEHQRLMSDAKDALGLCGALGGLVTCPNP